ncbi:DNA helicase [Marinibaculum pumilum]|uniref:DNA helicase n=1 Tax=Marinibaculum pumilum TaxID=1766165 RepID=A0ABV7L0J4_9PROT
MKLSAPLRLSAPLYRLKRQARQLSRRDGIPLHAALDRTAAAEGFRSWSLLAARHADRSPAARLYPRLSPGDLVLVAARPGQGKTLLSLELAAQAMRAGHRGIYFSLEDTEREVPARFAAFGADPARFGDRFAFDGDDGICADHVAVRLADCPPGTLAVIDYLQLLDQRRDTPPLADQMRRLRALAAEREAVLVFVSQIDRRYDPAAKPLPDLGDVRRPNPLDLRLFTKTCFLQGGKVHFAAAG